MYQFHTQEPVPRPTVIQKENLLDFAQNTQSAYAQANGKQRARLHELIGILEQRDFMPRSKTHTELYYAFKKIYGGVSVPDSVAELWVKVASMLELKSETPPGWRWDGLEPAPETEEVHYYGRHPILWKDRALPFGFQDPCYPKDLKDWKRSIPIDNSGGFRDPCLQYGFQRNAETGDLYYACCGLPLTHPGCWRGPVKNKIVPYQAADLSDWSKKMPPGTRYIVHESDNKRYDRIMEQVEELKKRIDPDPRNITVNETIILNRILALEKEYNRWSCAGEERKLVRLDDTEEDEIDFVPPPSPLEDDEVDLEPPAPLFPPSTPGDDELDFTPPAPLFPPPSSPGDNEVDLEPLFQPPSTSDDEDVTFPPVTFNFDQVKPQLLSNKREFERILTILNDPSELLKLYIEENRVSIDSFKSKLSVFSGLVDSVTPANLDKVINADTELQNYTILMETIVKLQNFTLPEEAQIDDIDNELYKDVEMFKTLKKEYQLAKMVQSFPYIFSPEYPEKVKREIDAFKLNVDEPLQQFLLSNQKYKVEPGDSDDVKVEKIRIQTGLIKQLIANEPLKPDDTNLQILLVPWRKNATEEQVSAFKITAGDPMPVKKAKFELQKKLLVSRLDVDSDLNAQILLAVNAYKSSGDISILDKWIIDEKLRYPSDTLNDLKLQYVIDQLNGGVPTTNALEDAITNLIKQKIKLTLEPETWEQALEDAFNLYKLDENAEGYYLGIKDLHDHQNNFVWAKEMYNNMKSESLIALIDKYIIDPEDRDPILFLKNQLKLVSSISPKTFGLEYRREILNSGKIPNSKVSVTIKDTIMTQLLLLNNFKTFYYDKFDKLKEIDLMNVSFQWQKGITPDNVLDKRYERKFKLAQAETLFWRGRNRYKIDETLAVDIRNYIESQVESAIANNDIDKFLDGELNQYPNNETLKPFKIEYIKAKFNFVGTKSVEDATKDLLAEIAKLAKVLNNRFQLTNDLMPFVDLTPESQAIVRGFKMPALPEQVPRWFNRLTTKQLEDSARFYLEFGQN